MGLFITEDQALRWVTRNPAWSLGIEDKVGSIEEGKMADLVIWDGHPFSVYTKTKFVIINGKIVFDRHKQKGIKSDFEVGQNNSQLFDGREFRKTTTTMNLQYPDSNQKTKFSPQSQPLIVKNVNYLRPSGKWQYGSVKIDKGLIAAVIPEKTSKALEKSSGNSMENSEVSKILKSMDKDVNVVDGQGKFLTPGFIDSLTQLGLMEISMEAMAYDHHTGVSEPTPNNRAVDALNLRSLRIPITRREGVTTAIARPSGHLISGMGVGFDLHEKSSYMNPQIAMFSQIGKSGYSSAGSSSRSMQWRDLRRIVDDVLSFSKAPNSYEKGTSRKYFLSKGDLKAMIPVLRGQIPWVVRAHRAQ